MPAAETRSILIRPADGAEDIAHARRLFQAYQASLSVDLCFQNFAEELSSLPGAYAPPHGCLLLAMDGAVPVGTVALRPLQTDSDAEMKRLFVVPEVRGLSIGRRLVAAVITHARRQGYRRLLLDTLPEMEAAQRLYRDVGFVETGPYVHNPVKGARYLLLTLV
jgi:ribosomal protein S18 acetylase RimI-like enzyme